MDADPFANGANPFDAIGYDDGGHGQSAPASPTADPFANGANPFAKIGYDDGSPPAQHAPVSPHPGALANDPGDDYTSGLAKGAATAAIKGAGHWLGFAGDIGQTVGYADDWVQSKFTGKSVDQIAADKQAAMDKMHAATESMPGVAGTTAKWLNQHLDPPSGADISGPILKQTGEYVPASELGRLSMAATETAVGSVGPAVGAARAPEAIGAVTSKGALATAAAAGAAGQGAEDVTGSPMAGIVAGYGAPRAAVALGRSLSPAMSAARSTVPPLTAAGRETAARSTVGSEMQGMASDPEAAVSNLTTQPAELVPGSVGTTAQIAGDPGLTRWEKSIRTTPGGGAALEQRAIEQNNARQDYLGTLQPDGNVLDLPAGLREQQAATDASTQAHIANVDASTAARGQLADTVTQANVTAAERAHQTAIAELRALKPDASPADLTSRFRATLDTLDAETEAKVSAANQAANAARGQIAPSGRSASEVGAALRQPAADALADSKQRTAGLWRAVDPDGTMVMPASPIADAARSIAGEVTRSATPMAGEEARIFDVAASYDRQMPFREVTDLRSSISTAMRAAQQSGDAQSLRRLTMLRGSVESAIDHSIENRAALDQIAVKRGTMAPEDAMEARMRDLWGVQNDRSIDARSSVARAGTGTEGLAGGGTADSAGRIRTGRAAPGGVGQAPGDQGVPPPPSLDAEAAGRLTTASAATREQSATFKQGAAGAILREGGNKGEYDLSDARVSAAVFRPGAAGGEAVRSYMGAGGSHEALFDAAAMSARDASIHTDGTLDGGKLSQWMAKHREALAAMPQDVSDRFLTSIDAHQAVEDALANRRDALSSFEKSEAGKAAKLSEPADIVRHVGTIIEGPAGAQRMGALAAAAKGDPIAERGLQRAVVEHVLDKYVPEVGDPRAEKLDAFLSAKGDALSKALSPADMDRLKAQSNEIKATSAAAGKAVSSRDTIMQAMDLDRRAQLKAAEAERAAKMSDFQRGVVAQLVGTTKHGDILNILKGITNAKSGASQMEGLARRAAGIDGGPDALKRGIQEMIQREVNSTTASGAAETMEQRRATLASLMATKRDVFQAAGLSHHQINKLDLIVQDGMRANRSISLAKARGGSDTEANKQLRLEHAGSVSVLNRIAHEAAGLGLGAGAGWLLAGPAGSGVGAAAQWLGRTAIGHLREAGLARVRELRIEAALHPELGLELLRQAPKGADKTTAAARVAQRARQLAVLQAGSQGRRQQ